MPDESSDWLARSTGHLCRIGVHVSTPADFDETHFSLAGDTDQDYPVLNIHIAERPHIRVVGSYFVE